MSRRSKAVKRTILPDARYDSQTVSKFINIADAPGQEVHGRGNFLRRDGSRRVPHGPAGRERVQAALQNIKPVVEVKSRRVGGATYQVPVEVRPERRTALGMRWLMQYSRERSEKSMAEKLAAEVIAASKGEGNA